MEELKIRYDALAVLHERVGPHGGPIMEGTFAGMIKEGLNFPKSRAINTSITVDKEVAGGQTWLEFDEYSKIAMRNDFPRA